MLHSDTCNVNALQNLMFDTISHPRSQFETSVPCPNSVTPDSWKSENILLQFLMALQGYEKGIHTFTDTQA